MKLTIFTGKICPKCPAAKSLVEEVSKEFGCELEVLDIQEHMLIALQNQIASTPSILIDNEVVFRSEIPAKEQLIDEIKKRM